MESPQRFDVVVVGGGIAGMTAALRAAELGLSVAVLEQGNEECYPCNTRFSGGLLHSVHLDVNRPAEELRAAIDRSTSGTAAPALADAIAADGRRLLAWLRGNGVRFMHFSNAEAHRWGMAPPRPVGPGLSWQGRGPDVMLRGLTAHLTARGGRVILGARAESLLRDGDTVVGVQYRQAGSACRAHATRASVLADGGFQADLDLYRAHIGPKPERVLQRGAATGRGDGLRMATAVGAATSPLHRFYGHLLSREALHDDRVCPYPDLDAIGAAGIVVDNTARRFADEGQGGIALANAIGQLADPASTTAIFDAAIWAGPGTTGRLPANPLLEKFGGVVHRAPTLAALAQQIGLPAQPLEDTVAGYNAAVRSGTTAALSPPRSSAKSQPMPIAAPPFCAVPLCAGITHTMGGVVIDGDGCVLRPDASVIPGLYAAGATTGGLEGGGEQGVGYVGGLIKAVFGLRAAEHIVAHAPAQLAGA